MASLAAMLVAIQGEFAAAPEGLREHVRRVEIEALDLCSRWDVDPERMKLAVWGHDLFRAVPEGEQVAMAESAGVRVRRSDRLAPVVLHGPTAAAVLCARFELTDEDVLSAISQHTLGAPEMPLMAKILLIADKVERRKRERSPAMVAIRRAARRDLDLAMLCWADWKWVEERTAGWAAHSSHWKARRRWVREHHADRGGPWR